MMLMIKTGSLFSEKWQSPGISGNMAKLVVFLCINQSHKGAGGGGVSFVQMHLLSSYPSLRWTSPSARQDLAWRMALLPWGHIYLRDNVLQIIHALLLRDSKGGICVQIEYLHE